MNCGRVSNQLSAYLDRELTGMEMLQIRCHLSDCDRCCAEYEALQRMKMLLGRLRSIEPPQAFVTEAVRRVEGSGTRLACTRPGRGTRPWLWAGTRRLASPPAAAGTPARGGRALAPAAPRLARRFLGAVPWQRLTLGLTTAALAAALIFTNVVLRRHSDTLVASTPSFVLDGRQDQLEIPPLFDETPGGFALRDVSRDRLPNGQTSLPWVNVSLQGESSWTFR
jgi:anti-sigma factor RsiW